MPIKTVVNKKYILQQLLILLPLSLSGIYLAVEAISSRSGNNENAVVQQSAPAPSQGTSTPSGRRANTSGSTSNRTPLEDPPLIPGDPAGAVPVDGGLGLLLAAGVGYGVKRMYIGRQKMD